MAGAGAPFILSNLHRFVSDHDYPHGAEAIDSFLVGHPLIGQAGGDPVISPGGWLSSNVRRGSQRTHQDVTGAVTRSSSRHVTS